MRRGGGRQTKFARAAFVALGVRLALLAVALALIAQTLAFGAHTARAGEEPRTAAAALASAVGSPVVLCVQDDGAPQDPGACPHACPMCHLASQTWALTENTAGLSAPPFFGIVPPAWETQTPAKTKDLGLPFARGPPRAL